MLDDKLTFNEEREIESGVVGVTLPPPPLLLLLGSATREHEKKKTPICGSDNFALPYTYKAKAATSPPPWLVFFRAIRRNL